jgi:peptide/nickel transport system substrate-binding protein
MTAPTRRGLLKLGAAGAAQGSALSSLLWSPAARAAIGDTLTIAYNVSLGGFNGNTAASSPGIQSIYRTIYDTFMEQREDLSLEPGLCDEFGWNSDKTRINLRLRKGATWHDGEPVTPDDVLWNLQQMADPKSGNNMAATFTSMKDFRVDGNVVSCEVSNPWRVNILQRLTFFACYLIPKNYWTKVGAAGFEKAPVGSGPYMFEQFERGSFLRLRANPNYWGGKPVFEKVVFKFVTDASSRVAEIERGSSDLTLDLPFEEVDRLSKKPGLTAVWTPISDIAFMFFNSDGVMADENIRKAAVHAIDKKTITTRLLGGHAVPIDTLLTPNYLGYDPSIVTPYDPKLAAELLAKSGYSKDKPVQVTVQTTRGYKPKDYETVEAIAGMWRRVGINANIEVYEPAKHMDLRNQHKLAPIAFYDWGNSTGDPESSLSALNSKTPFSSFKSPEVDARLIPLLGERDEAKRLAGYKALDRFVAEGAYILPLFQYQQPVVYKSELSFTPHVAGYILPSRIGRKA